jgi:hypothetical protein
MTDNTITDDGYPGRSLHITEILDISTREELEDALARAQGTDRATYDAVLAELHERERTTGQRWPRATTTTTEDEFEAQVLDEPGHGGWRFTVPMRLHLNAGSKAEALELAMRWRDAIGCPGPEFFGHGGRDAALNALDFDWHLHHPWGC